jgi:two-component system LytT family sensor kinase
MKFFWKYLFPAVFGLLVYFTIRAVNDTTAHEKFWERKLSLNTIEITCSIIAGYITRYVLDFLIRKFDSRQQTALTRKTVVQEFIIVFLVNALIVNCTISPIAAVTDDGLGLNDVAILNIVPSLYALLYFAIVRGNRYLQIFIEQRIQLEKTAHDKLEAELKFLKAQYHPHFLFNALNTVYFQMDESISDAKKSIERFSELLRYQLYDQQQKVSISQEIDYLRNFIDLQKIRSSDKLQLQVQFDEQLCDQKIYPLLLLPLVENAFKYVNGSYQIGITGTLDQKQLCFRVVNTTSPLINGHKPGGIGLENLKRRLELLYPGKHSFNTSIENAVYTAELKLEFEKEADR